MTQATPDQFQVPPCPTFVLSGTLSLVAAEQLDQTKESFIVDLKAAITKECPEWTPETVTIAAFRYLFLHDFLSSQERRNKVMAAGELVPKGASAAVYGKLLLATIAIAPFVVDTEAGRLVYDEAGVFSLLAKSKELAQKYAV